MIERRSSFFILPEVREATMHPMAPYIFRHMLLEALRGLRGCGCMISARTLMPLSEMRQLKTVISEAADLPEKDLMLRLIAKYLKLHRCWEACSCESWFSFLGYSKALREQSDHGDAAAAEIMSDSGFRRIEKYAMDAVMLCQAHPKVDMLLDLCIQLKYKLGLHGLIFADNVELAGELAQMLSAGGMSAAVISGGHGRNREHHRQAARRLLEGKLDFIVCTSVLDRYGALPDLKAPAVINYTQPATPEVFRRRLARASGTGIAYVYYIVTDDSPEGWFYHVRRMVRREDAAAYCPEPPGYQYRLFA